MMGDGKGKGGKGFGKGGSGKGGSFSLPDIIKKQEALNQKLKDGMKPGEGEGKKEGKGKGKNGQGEAGNGQKSREQLSGEQYQIYQEQNALRQALQNLLDKESNGEGKGGSKGKKALQQMEELEKQLLEKGFTNQVLQQMINMEHELLKLEKARKQQGKDNKRKSETNNTKFSIKPIPKIKNKKLYFNPNEILNREPLPLRNIYKKKVQEYFKDKSN